MIKKLGLGVLVFLSIVLTVALSYPLINKVVKNTTEINKYVFISRDLLGFNGKRHILILFMNNAETRHGGGFIGTVGLARTENGILKVEPIRSVYYYDHVANDPNYYVESLKGPKGEEVKQSFTLRDSGQNMSWDTDALRAKRIFEKESGEKVDYVVGLTPEVLKNLLHSTGPVKLDDYNLTVSYKNILETVQLEVESGQDKTDRKDPKTVLTSLANKLGERMSSKSLYELINIGYSVASLTESRQVVLYSSHDAVQKILEAKDLSGRLKKFDGDYLGFSETNLFATKTGSFMKRSLAKTTTVGSQGDIDVEVVFGRQHTATERMYKYYDPVMEGYNYLVAHDNVSVKIALPANSKITASTVGLNLVGKEKDYDIYSTNPLLTDLSSSNQFTIGYKLPYKLYMADQVGYSSFTQLPVGTHPITITNCMIFPDDYSLVASNIKNLVSENHKNKICYDNKETTRDELTSYIYAKR